MHTQLINGVNDPATDTAGAFWNFMSGGAESGNLTTAGDIVYYGGTGPKINRW